MNNRTVAQTVHKITPNFNNDGAYRAFPETATGQIIRHRIYNRLLFHLENRQIRFIKTGQTLPFILHPNTKKVWGEKYGVSPVAIENAENSILVNAKKFPDLEVTRDAPSALFYDLRQTGETDLINASRIVVVPNFVLNALVCEELAKEFSRSDILGSAGFVWHEGYIRLDLDDSHVRRGFMMPIFRQGLITALRVFRYPKDERPFSLRTRKNILEAIH